MKGKQRGLTWINAAAEVYASIYQTIWPDGAGAVEEMEAMSNRQMWEIVRNQNPVILPGSALVQEACRSMRDRQVGAILVAGPSGKLIGIFTGRDAVCRIIAEGRDLGLTTLADVMTRQPDVMAPGKTAIEALRMMRDGGYRHLPVVDGDKIVGIVSSGDFRGLERARLDEETGLWERI